MARRKRRKADSRAASDAPAAAAADARAAARRGTPRWSLALVTVLLPLAMLALVEGGLQVAGYGHDLEPLFIDAPGMPGYRQANPRAVLRLVPDPMQAPSVSIETAYFRASRAPGSFRVVVQGASSAAGFPYGLGASLAGELEQRLRLVWPEREIEVIQTAMAAVNSYALVDFAPEILAQQPDAVVVYIGHNEYLGILGVGSTMRLASSPWVTRAYLAVRELRLFQLMQSFLPRVAAPPAPPTAGDETLMARVAGERSIPLDSTLYRRGLDQYEHNLGELLATYRRAGVPVFIGTVASNERDQPPFAGARAREAFERGRQLEAAGDSGGAREAYRSARDLDELRFRAPGAFNDIVRRVAARERATVVDSQQRLADASPGGIVGASLMLEHVHPNLDGYFLLADAFFDALLESDLLGEPEVSVRGEVARTEMPVTEIDRWLGEYKVGRLKSGWPFRDRQEDYRLPPATSEGERLAQALFREQTDWPRAQDALRRHYRETGDVAGYAHVTTVLADAFPTAHALQFEAAAALIERQRPQDALRYARRAAGLGPQAVNSWLVLGHALALLGRRDEAIAALERALELEPGNATARAALERLRPDS
jgi:tetratricopeptide (TPR) repeat protein